MLRNQATALLKYEHLTTTVPRAKELRPFVERLITIAKRSANGSGKEKTGVAEARALHARRLVMQDLQDREVVSKLFDTIAPRFATRPGGYTRLLRIGFRKGDSAEVAQVELVGSEFDPKAKTQKEAPSGEKPKATGVGGRLRAAADRLRGKKDADSPATADADKSAKRQAGKSKAAPKRTRQKSG